MNMEPVEIIILREQVNDARDNLQHVKERGIEDELLVAEMVLSTLKRKLRDALIMFRTHPEMFDYTDYARQVESLRMGG